MQSEREPPLSVGEAAVLAALLAGPRHGYEVASLFAGLGVTEVLPVEPPTVYGYLRSLEAAGLVEWREERAGHRPPRKVYRLTGAGRQRAETWLGRPVERLRQVRQEFILKLAFLDLLGRGRAREELVASQLAACRTYRERVLAESASTPVSVLTRQSRLSAADATIAWLQTLLEPEAIAP